MDTNLAPMCRTTLRNRIRLCTMLIALGSPWSSSHSFAEAPAINDRDGKGERFEDLSFDDQLTSLAELHESDQWADAQNAAERLTQQSETVATMTEDQASRFAVLLRRLDRPDLVLRIERRVTLAASDSVWLAQALQRQGRLADADVVTQRAWQRLAQAPDSGRGIVTDLARYEFAQLSNDPDAVREVIHELESRYVRHAEPASTLAVDQFVDIWEACHRLPEYVTTDRLTAQLVSRIDELARSNDQALLRRVLDSVEHPRHEPARRRIFEAIDQKIVQPDLRLGVETNASNLATVCRLYSEFQVTIDSDDRRGFDIFVARSVARSKGNAPAPEDCQAIAKWCASDRAMEFLTHRFDQVEASLVVGRILAIVHTMNGSQSQWLADLEGRMTAATSSAGRVRMAILRAHTLKWHPENDHDVRLYLRVLARQLNQALAESETDEDRVRCLRELAAIPRSGGHFDQALRLIDEFGGRVRERDSRAELATLRTAILQERNLAAAREREHQQNMNRHRRDAYAQEQKRRAQERAEQGRG